MSNTPAPDAKPKRHWYQYASVALIAALLVAADKKPEKAPSAAQIQLWIKQLGDDDFKVREEATRDLIKSGGIAFDAVTEATKSEDAEVKQRALMILKHHEEVAKQLEKAAIAYFKKLGGRVTFVEKNPGIGLELSETHVTDAGLVHLKGLTKLQELYLGGTKVTDTGLGHLKGLTKIQKLGLGTTYITTYHTKITNDGLVHLKGLAKLQRLYLPYTKVTDVGLVHLKGLTSLRELDLRGTKVTDVGIKNLQKALPKCRIVWDGE